MSTKCITCPPSNFPKGFVCAGNTISVISDREALTGLPFSANSPLISLFTSCLRFIRSPFLACFQPQSHYPYNTGANYARPKENPPPDARRVRCQQTRRRLLPLRPRDGVHEQRRPQRRRRPLPSPNRAQRRLYSYIPYVWPASSP